MQNANMKTLNRKSLQLVINFTLLYREGYALKTFTIFKHFENLAEFFKWTSVIIGLMVDFVYFLRV